MPRIISRWLSAVERVVLNALANTCGFVAGYLRVPRIISHRLQETPIAPQRTESVRRFTTKAKLRTRTLLACSVL